MSYLKSFSFFRDHVFDALTTQDRNIIFDVNFEGYFRKSITRPIKPIDLGPTPI